ncbi:MAG: hypothetical protein RKL32_11600 [Gammaproteobacteria bacterium]
MSSGRARYGHAAGLGLLFGLLLGSAGYRLAHRGHGLATGAAEQQAEQQAEAGCVSVTRAAATHD